MKHAVFVGTCVIAVLVSSCTLPDPVAYGDKCTGIKAENIVWGITDPCMKDGDRQICDAEAEDVIQLAGGYCPIGFICRHDEAALPWCVHSCPEGQVFCGDACINPKTSISYCGASLGSVCDSKTRGENCMERVRQDGFAYTCDEHEGCKKTICPIDTYLSHDETCLPNNDENCGLEGFSCGKDKECIHGDCKIRCPKDYIRCDDKNGESLCIYPENNTMFCGAKGKCLSSDPESEDYQGEACGEGMTCAQGHCVVWKCDKENERLCDDKCIDVTQDPLNCGGCGYNCADNRPPHVTDEVACEDRQCVYTCEAGYENCGPDGTMECVDLTWDWNHCGACGEACGPNAYCMASTCKFVSCPDEHACLQKGVCVTHDPTACGSDCRPCGSDLNACEATCDDVGECHVVRCCDGYTFVSETEPCQENTPEVCGSVDKADVMDCTTLPHVSSVQCLSGECQIEKCETGYYLLENVCETDTDDNCGSYGNKCQVPNGTSHCQNGTCITTGCDAGFHQEENYCTGDDLNSCGGTDCTAIPGWLSGLCEDMSCKATGCQPGFYLDGSTCKANDQNNCGTKGKKCTVSNGTATCNTSTGTCSTTGCNTGYYLDGSTCKSNDQNNCGTKGKKCTVSNGTSTCDTSTGTCSTTGCNTGYYLDGSTCKSNDQNNCGTKGKKCTVSNGTATCNTSTGTCNTTGCNTGYYLDGSTCKSNDQNNCGTKGKKCTVSNGTATCNTSTGTCSTTGCNTGYYLDGSTCKANDQNNCGTKGKKCTVSNGTATCDTSTGTCSTTGCNTGYYLDGSTCKANDQNNCGTKGKKCTVSNGTATCNTSTGTCSTTGCNTGYYLDGSTCKANDQNNCGTKGKKCTVSHGTATCNTSMGTCSTTGCDMWFELVDGACVSTLVVGAEVEFGRYPQDENSDVPSPLTWLILDVSEDSALLISKYALEQYEYHDKYEDITWEQSNVRSYLNGLGAAHNKNGIDHTGKGFIDVAFNADERAWIKLVTNINPDAPESWGSTPGGNNTEDKIFLLSHDEVLQYFPTNKSRLGHPTAYAIHPPTSSGRRNVYTCQVTCSGDNSCSVSGCNYDGINVQACSNVQCGSAWCLRSPGDHPDYAAVVSDDGGVSSYGVRHGLFALRPALYVYLNL